MRRSLLVILSVLLLCPTWSGEEPAPVLRTASRLTTTRMLLDETDPNRRRVGALTYLGGIHLKSDDRAFGGFSAMTVSGERFLLLSDLGTAFSFRMGADWRLREARLKVLPSGPGGGWLRQHRDSESLTYDPATRRTWVGFENSNSIWRYAAGLAQAEAFARPAVMRRWPRNGGAEAMLRLRSGRFVVIAESAKVQERPGTRALLVFDRDPTERGARVFAATYLPPYGYSPTDAVELPNGRLLVLNRDVSLREGFTARLTIVDPAGLRAGTQLRGREIARFAAPVIHDNFEALAVTREGADTIVWMASDDNAPTWFQRSLLLKFRLELPDAKTRLPGGRGASELSRPRRDQAAG